MSTQERLNVSFDARTAARVRQCGAQTRGGASAYLAKLVARDELQESARAHARWFTENPSYLVDAEEEREAAAAEVRHR